MSGEIGINHTTEFVADLWPQQSSCMEIETHAWHRNVYNVNSKTIVNTERILNHGESKNNVLTLKILTWNVRSINKTSKVRKLVEERPDIIMLQEIWQPKEETLQSLPFSRLTKTRPKGEDGGGTMIMWNNDALTPDERVFDINQDSFLTKFIIASNRYIWLSSIYINRGTIKNFMDTMASIQLIVPESEWPYLMLCGDWNLDIDPYEGELLDEKTWRQKVKRANAVKEICKQMGLMIKYSGGTRKNSVIDYVLHGSALSFEDDIYLEDREDSDHSVLIFRLNISCPIKTTKLFKVPNKKLATSFTINSLIESEDAADFLRKIEDRLRSVDLNMMMEIKRKPFKKELLQRLMATVEEDDDLKLIVNDYWTEKAEENEMLRFSSKSREAFEFLKKVFRYHEYNKRDGSIISRIIDKDGNLITDEDRVCEELIIALRKIQLKEDEPMYSEEEPFPWLGEPTDEEMTDMLRQLSTNKALAFDGVTDILFSKEYRTVTGHKLKNLWNVLAQGNNILRVHFDQRLLPLNKVHPQVPKPQDCRPIIVSSPLVKLLEVRIKRKLEKYIMENLICCQTGFVPNSGISVNQVRLLERVRKRTASEVPCMRKHVFGLFLDFSNAYNTIPHQRLFTKLLKALSLAEVQMVKAIYSRCRIKLGNHSFTPNVGVAQGSVIFPALFNIYCEDLYEDVRDIAVVNVEDILGYADASALALYKLKRL